MHFVLFTLTVSCMETEQGECSQTGRCGQLLQPYFLISLQLMAKPHQCTVNMFRQKTKHLAECTNTLSCCFEEDLCASQHTAQVSSASVCTFTAREGVLASFPTEAHHVLVWEGPGLRRLRAGCRHSWRIKGSWAFSFRWLDHMWDRETSWLKNVCEVRFHSVKVAD